MKTIEVTDEVYEKLVETSKEMASQDYLCTTKPLYCVYQKELVPNINGEGNIVKYFDPNNLEEYYEDELIERLREYYGDTEFEERTKELDPEFNSTYLDDIAEEFGYRRISYDEIDVPVGGMGGSGSQVYLTRKAAQKHIDSNGYHYRKPFVYVVAAVRNYEMQLIQNLVYNICNTGEYHT